MRTVIFGNLETELTSMDINPIHIYEEDGTYEVLLIAQNAHCEPDTFSQSIIVDINAVTAAFNAQNTSGCPDLSVQFNNLSANATDFQWQFEGGEPNSSMLPNPTILYDFPGTYSVTLIASNEEDADTLTLNNFVQVDTAAMPNFEFEAVITTAYFYEYLSLWRDFFMGFWRWNNEYSNQPYSYL